MWGVPAPDLAIFDSDLQDAYKKIFAKIKNSLFENKVFIFRLDMSNETLAKYFS
jgi:hypothetical protein